MHPLRETPVVLRGKKTRRHVHRHIELTAVSSQDETTKKESKVNRYRFTKLAIRQKKKRISLLRLAQYTMKSLILAQDER